MRIILLAICLILAPTFSVAAKQPQSQDATRQLFRAIRSGDQDGVLQAIEDGIDVNATRHGLSAFHTAKRAGFEEIAQLLAENGAETTIQAPAVSEAIDAFLGEQFTSKTPACAVLVSRDGQILAEKAYGMADIEKGVAATTDTKFLIGSVTKQFTAAAILKLQEEGKLSVQDKLAKFLPDFPRGDEVTLHHLLTHTSGITSYTSKPDFMLTVTKPTNEEDLIDSFKNDPFDFDPGEKYSYCNSGYFLLGHIIGIVTKSSLAEYLDKTFFTPLDMNQSGIHSPEKNIENHAKGYSVQEGTPELATVWHMSRAGGAGAIYSTLGDLHKWNEAVFGGKVLSEESLKAAFRPTKLNDGTTSDYGYGWQLGQQRGIRAIQHSGGLDGFVSNLVRYPKQNVTVVAFVNATAGGLPSPPVITANIGEYLLWDQMQPRKPRVVDKTVDPETFSDFVGIYDYGASMILEVTLEDDQLYGQLSGQDKYPIFPRGPSEFFWKITEAEVEFVRDESGKVVEAIHRQNGSTSNNEKLESPPTVQLTNEQLEAFVGTYDYASAILTVTREGNQLLAKLSGQDAYRIYPESETTFVWRAVKAKIEFVKDDDGNVIKGIHTQAGRTFDVAKIQPVQTIQMATEKLDDYVGRYNYGFLAGKMVVKREKNKLMAKLRGQPSLEIVPIAEDEFRWKDVNASIKFVRDDEGKIIHGLHTQSGKTITVPRVKEKVKE